MVVAFWTLLWQYVQPDDPINIQVHGTTMIFTVIDFYLNYSKMKFKSTFVSIILFGILYVIWSIIWNFITDEAIYPVLDWKNEPVVAFIVSLIVAIVSLLIHLFLCWSNNKYINKCYAESHSQFIALAENVTDNVNDNHIEIGKDHTVTMRVSTADYGTGKTGNAATVTVTTT